MVYCEYCEEVAHRRLTLTVYCSIEFNPSATYLYDAMSNRETDFQPFSTFPTSSGYPTQQLSAQVSSATTVIQHCDDWVFRTHVELIDSEKSKLLPSIIQKDIIAGFFFCVISYSKPFKFVYRYTIELEISRQAMVMIIFRVTVD